MVSWATAERAGWLFGPYQSQGCWSNGHPSEAHHYSFLTVACTFPFLIIAFKSWVSFQSSTQLTWCEQWPTEVSLWSLSLVMLRPWQLYQPVFSPVFGRPSNLSSPTVMQQDCIHQSLNKGAIFNFTSPMSSRNLSVSKAFQSHEILPKHNCYWCKC